MPFQSKSQWDKFSAMKSRGEISKGTYDEWAHESRPYQSLPESKGMKSKKKKRRRIAGAKGY